MFERLRHAIHQMLDAAATGSPAGRLAAMRDAATHARMAVEQMRSGVPRTERQLAAERRALDDAERRGRLAAGIQDLETVEVAGRFASKHRERVGVLERKLAAQRAELALAEREYEEMKQALLAAERARPAADATRRAESAWRAMEAAGGTRPDAAGAGLQRDLDRRARERLAEEQLETLKRRMGRE